MLSQTTDNNNLLVWPNRLVLPSNPLQDLYKPRVLWDNLHPYLQDYVMFKLSPSWLHWWKLETYCVFNPSRHKWHIDRACNLLSVQRSCCMAHVQSQKNHTKPQKPICPRIHHNHPGIHVQIWQSEGLQQDKRGQSLWWHHWCSVLNLTTKPDGPCRFVFTISVLRSVSTYFQLLLELPWTLTHITYHFLCLC